MPKTGTGRDGRNRREGRLKAVPTEADRGILGKDGKCNSLKRDGKARCTQPAGQGTDHPGFGACQYHGGNSPSLVRHAAKQHVRLLAQELEMEPDEAIAWSVRMSAGVVSWLQNQIEHVDESNPEEMALLPELIKSYGEERDRMARISKLAIDAGIAEREMQLQEQEVAILAQAIRNILADLNLNAEQRALAPAIARKHLLALPPARVS